MTAALLILPLLLANPNSQKKPDQFHGKTPAQIVAMGRKEWMKFYTGIEGDSTIGMAGAEISYGEALQVLNNQKIKKLPAPKQKWFADLRKRLTDFSVTSQKIGEAMTGGGTMWININSSIIPDVEQLLGALLPPHQGYTSKSELSIPAEIKKLAAKVAENAKDIDFMGKDNGMNVAYCHKYLKQLSDQYQKFGPVLKAAQPSHQRAIKEFLARAVSIATNSLNPE